MELLFYKYNVCDILAQCFHGFQRNCLMLRVVLHPKWLSNSRTPVALRGTVKSCRFLFHKEQWFWSASCQLQLKHWVNKYTVRYVWTFTLFLLDFVGLVIMTNIFKLFCSCSRHRWFWPCWSIFFLNYEDGWVGRGLNHILYVIMNN